MSTSREPGRTSGESAEKAQATRTAALSIAGLDPSGGAGIIADLRTFEALGVYGMAVVTSVTYQSTIGVLGRYDLAPEVVSSQLDALFSDTPPAAVKTGMLGRADTIAAVARALEEHEDWPVVVDPVMQSSDGKPLLAVGGLEAMLADLMPRATLVMPNVAELEALCGFELFDVSDLRTGAYWLARQGARGVLVTGWRLEEEGTDYAADLFFDGADFEVFKTPWVEGLRVHGTGCVMSAAVTAHLARGTDLRGAVELGARAVSLAIEGAVAVGKGIPCANPGAISGS